MKIALVGPSITENGGVASVLKELKHYLENRAEEVILIPTTDGSSLRASVLAFIKAICTIARLCIFKECDVVHIHMASRGSWLRKSVIATVCLILKRPYLIHLHGAEFREFYEHELGRLGSHITRVIFGRAAFVIALSKIWQTWIESKFPKVRTAVVFNGVQNDESLFKIRAGTKTVLFLGRLGQRKGVGELIEAVRKLTDAGLDVALELGGDGDIERYRNNAADLSNVRFLNWLDESKRRRALERADVFCLPSWNEGLPMSVLEAMSVGLPVVSTMVGGIPEAIVNGETGILVAPGDVDALANALIGVLGDSQAAFELGRKGRERQQAEFSVMKMGARCLSLYQNCIFNHDTISGNQGQ